MSGSSRNGAMLNQMVNEPAFGRSVKARRMAGMTCSGDPCTHALSARHRCPSGLARRCSARCSDSGVGFAYWRDSARCRTGQSSNGASTASAWLWSSTKASAVTVRTGPWCGSPGGVIATATISTRLSTSPCIPCSHVMTSSKSSIGQACTVCANSFGRGSVSRWNRVTTPKRPLSPAVPARSNGDPPAAGCGQAHAVDHILLGLRQQHCRGPPAGQAPVENPVGP